MMLQVLICGLLAFTPQPKSADCRISFYNLQAARGNLYVAVYDAPYDFLNTQKVKAKQNVPVTKTGAIELSFPGLPPGRYAVSCFHDLNGNGTLDTNMWGIPTEPYGFSNNARPMHRAPNWEEASFSLTENGNALKIRLETW